MQNKESGFDTTEVLSLLESIYDHIFIKETKIFHIDGRSIEIQNDRIKRLKDIFSSVRYIEL
jgi:hypothetical protein